MTFGWHSIAGENSWITTDENTNVDELKLWLNNELNKLPAIIDKYKNVDEIIEEERKSNYPDNINYAFLLHDNNKKEEFKLWIKDRNKKIEELKIRNLDLSRQLEKLQLIPNFAKKYPV